MKAVFKHAEGKPPFIGVLFESDERANINSLFVDRYGDLEFDLSVSTNYGYLYFSLRNEKNNLSHYYRSIKYNDAEYKVWRAYSHLKMNFGHCVMKGDQLTVARTESGKLFVLKLGSFSI